MYNNKNKTKRYINLIKNKNLQRFFSKIHVD